MKFKQVVENAERILAIALMAGAERLDYRRPLKPSVETEKVRCALRAWVPPLEEDVRCRMTSKPSHARFGRGGLAEWAA